jgi:hypothetical protein
MVDAVLRASQPVRAAAVGPGRPAAVPQTPVSFTSHGVRLHGTVLGGRGSGRTRPWSWSTDPVPTAGSITGSRRSRSPGPASSHWCRTSAPSATRCSTAPSRYWPTTRCRPPAPRARLPGLDRRVRRAPAAPTVLVQQRGAAPRGRRRLAAGHRRGQATPSGCQSRPVRRGPLRSRAGAAPGGPAGTGPVGNARPQFPTRRERPHHRRHPARPPHPFQPRFFPHAQHDLRRHRRPPARPELSTPRTGTARARRSRRCTPGSRSPYNLVLMLSGLLGYAIVVVVARPAGAEPRCPGASGSWPPPHEQFDVAAASGQRIQLPGGTPA